MHLSRFEDAVHLSMTCSRFYKYISAANEVWFSLYKKALTAFTYSGITIQDDEYIKYDNCGTFVQEVKKEDSDEERPYVTPGEWKRYFKFWQILTLSSDHNTWWADGFFSDYDVEFYEALIKYFLVFFLNFEGRL
jgi:hypothetical protein